MSRFFFFKKRKAQNRNIFHLWKAKVIHMNHSLCCIYINKTVLLHKFVYYSCYSKIGWFRHAQRNTLTHTADTLRSTFSFNHTHFSFLLFHSLGTDICLVPNFSYSSFLSLSFSTMWNSAFLFNLHARVSEKVWVFCIKWPCSVPYNKLQSIFEHLLLSTSVNLLAFLSHTQGFWVGLWRLLSDSHLPVP